jgi:replication factor A1
MSLKLTPGAVQRLYSGNTDQYEPVVQVIECKDNPNRFRCVISDGAEVQQCVINKDNNPQLKENYCIKITDAVLNRISNRPQPLLTVLRFNIVSMSTQVIGKPDLSSLASTTNPTTTSTSQQRTTTSQQQPRVTNQQAPRNQNNNNNNRGRGASSSRSNEDIDESQVMPITALNPYASKWVIKARVTKKGELKQWKKADKSGYIFAVDLIDEHKGEIKASAFNSAAQKFHDIFQEGGVYLIANGKLKHANKKFSNLPNDYEITLEESTVVKEVQDDAHIPSVQFSFKSIDEITSVGKDQIVDLVAVVQDPGQCAPQLLKKTNTETFIRKMKVMDGDADHVSTIELTLWGKHAQLDFNEGQVICAKGLRTSDFNGTTLSSVFSSQLFVDAQGIPEAGELLNWYGMYQNNPELQRNVKAASTRGDGARKYRPTNYLSDIKKYNLGLNCVEPTKGDVMMIVGTITFISDKGFFYPACPNEACKGKKVESAGDFDDANWFCSKCNKPCEKPEYRYVVSMKVADISDEQWITAFSDSATTIFGTDANTMKEHQQSNEPEFQAIVHGALFKQYSMRVKITEDNRQSNDEGTTAGSKVRLQLLAAYPMTYTTQSKRLLSLINNTA